MSKVVNYKGWNCTVIIMYPPVTDRTIIYLQDADTGEPVAHADVNIYEKMYSPGDWDQLRSHGVVPTSELPQNKCYIKTWSENEGILEVLEDAGIVKPELKFNINQFGSMACLVEILE